MRNWKILRRVLKISKSDYYFRHVCLSVHIEQHGSQFTGFLEISYVNTYLRYIVKSQFWLKSDKNNAYFTWKLMDIYNKISLNSS
jgi:hypothetical protein